MVTKEIFFPCGIGYPFTRSKNSLSVQVVVAKSPGLGGQDYWEPQDSILGRFQDAKE